MGKYNRLPVGLDGSETSLHALRESFKISKNRVTVVTVAPSYEGDLRIMGSHGRTGLTRLLMGGVTERVIGHAPCPVLVVKDY